MGVQHNGASAGEKTGITGRIALSASEGTHACADEARRLLEAAGCTVLPGIAGDLDTQETPFASGEVDGLLQISLAALADTLFGGLHTRQTPMERASVSGIPMVVVPGDLDSVRFASREAVPLRFGRRRFHTTAQNELVMRADISDSAQLGRLLAEKLNAAIGPVLVCLPLRGYSALGAPDGPLRWMEADMALIGNLTTHIRHDIAVRDFNTNVNDPEFARLCADSLLELLRIRA